VLVAVEHVEESVQSSTDVELDDEETIDVVLEHALLLSMLVEFAEAIQEEVELEHALLLSMIVELAEDAMQGDATEVELALLLELERISAFWLWFLRGAARAPCPIREARRKIEQDFDNILR